MKILILTNAEGVATPGTDDVGGPKANEIIELRRTAEWHDPPEEIREEEDLFNGEELKLFQMVAARFNFPAMDEEDVLYSVKNFMREMASQRTQDLITLKSVARYTVKYRRMTCKYAWTELGNNIEVFLHSGVAMWSGQFVKAWSKTMGVLALSSGESELAAAVKVATE